MQTISPSELTNTRSRATPGRKCLQNVAPTRARLWHTETAPLGPQQGHKIQTTAGATSARTPH